MSTQTQPVWTLNASGIIPPGPPGSQLAGCHITKNSAGTAYQFTAPNITNVLSTSGPPLPTASFTFPQFTYAGFNWIIEVNLPLTPGANGSGTWSIVSPKLAFASGTHGHGRGLPTAPQSGEYTAQAGSQTGEDDPV